jgi:hypothetical protein
MLNLLLDQLRSSTPESRIEALCALVMLEETQALGVLGEMWKTETHPEVRQALAWAGKQIQAARQEGYSTAATMAEVFRLNRGPDERDQYEKRLLSQIQTNAHLEKVKQHGIDQDNRVGQFARNAAAASALSLALGLGPGAAVGMIGPMISASSNLDDGSDNRPRIGQEPITPARPTSADINAWLKRLSDPNPKGRVAAILQLRDFNNPAALGPLGKRFATDPAPEAREAAQVTGKLIYFSALYWQQQDIKKPQATPRAESDVSAILARAQAEKQKRATRH